MHIGARHCPSSIEDGKRNNSRKTSYYCGACLVALHLECFHEFHKDKPEGFRAKRQIRRVEMPNQEHAGNENQTFV